MPNELKPCPFCGNEDVKLKDETDALYGFDGYQLLCIQCKCTMFSGSVHEHYWEGGKYHTPKTERAKEKALKELYDTWNRRANDEHR